MTTLNTRRRPRFHVVSTAQIGWLTFSILAALVSAFGFGTCM